MLLEINRSPSVASYTRRRAVQRVTKDQEITIKKLICKENQSLGCFCGPSLRVSKSDPRRDERRAILFAPNCSLANA